MADITFLVDGTNDATNHRFTSLSAAVAHGTANHADLTAYGILNIEISITTADTTAVQINGFTTDSTHYVHIYTTAAARHAGIWSDSKYRLYVANATALDIRDNHVWVDGLQVGKSSSNANSQGLIGQALVDTDNFLWVSNCILKQYGSSYYEWCFFTADAQSVFVIWNTIAYGAGDSTNSANSTISFTGTSCAIYNSTFINNGGLCLFGAGGTLTAKNVYVGKPSGPTITWTSKTLTNCASSDTSAGSSNGCVSNVAYSTDNFQSVTPGEATYLMVKSGGALHEAGATLTDDPPGSTALSTDIAGTTRS